MHMMQNWTSELGTWWKLMVVIGMHMRFVVWVDKVMDFVAVAVFYHVKAIK